MTPVNTTTPQTWPSTGVCDGCVMVNGVGYKSHWSDCTKFIQCTFQATGDVAVYVRSCKHGTFWDQRTLSCNHPRNTLCQHDPCQTPGYSSYVSTTNCRGYWQCRSGVSHALCCQTGHSYDVSRGCVPDAQCTDTCSTDIITKTCDKRAVVGRPLMYQQHVPGRGWVPMPCAQGTAFSTTNCSCTTKVNTIDVSCKPELYIPFTGDLTDHSGNNNYVQAVGVKLVNNTGYFDGKALMRIPRFSNLKYGDTMVIKLRYMQDGTLSGKPQALLANGDCNTASSMYIVTSPGKLSMGVSTDKISNTSLAVPVTSTGWQEVVMSVDKQKLEASVNGVSYQTLFTGSISNSKCALQIGRGSNFNQFTGYMDDITVYLCRPNSFY